MTDATTSGKSEDLEPVNGWNTFLEENPPGSQVRVQGAFDVMQPTPHATYYKLRAPELKLHCPEETCKGTMFFNSEDGSNELASMKWCFTYLTYRCRNCHKYTKTFSVGMRRIDVVQCDAYKVGEMPPFGPPIPNRVIRLIQSDRDLFLRGLRCESQGLGIAAFAYYRRVVEDQWIRLVSEVIRVAEAIDEPDETIRALEQAREEHQFKKALKDIKWAIPPTLLINGENPLRLLHSALSLGVHDLPDDECLGYATSIRKVLVELADNLGQALKDDKQLKEAINKLRGVESNRKKAND